MKKLLILAILCSGCSQPSASSAPSPTATPMARVAALARLEPASKVIKLQVPAGRQQDRVLRWYFQEGQSVRRGQLLVELDGAARQQQEVIVSEARLQQSRARLQQVLAGAKSGEVERQRGELQRLSMERQRQKELRQDELERWRMEAELTQRNYERFRVLYQQGAASALDLEQRQLAWNTARRQLETARNELRRSQDTLQAQIDSAQGELDRIQEVRPSDVNAAQAEVEASAAEVERARVVLEEFRIHAPQSGTLLRVHTREGERISSNGLAELAETAQMVAVAEVYQGDLARLRLQQPCQLVSNAFKHPLHGRIQRLGQQVQRQNIFSEQPGEQFDQRVVEVRVALDPESNKLARSWTNLQLQAVFE
ncbi:MAG: HlyD family efflux transporter periplasmic adaptor subunit [Vulcanimicrobiota bacterium]